MFFYFPSFFVLCESGSNHHMQSWAELLGIPALITDMTVAPPVSSTVASFIPEQVPSCKSMTTLSLSLFKHSSVSSWTLLLPYAPVAHTTPSAKGSLPLWQDTSTDAAYSCLSRMDWILCSWHCSPFCKAVYICLALCVCAVYGFSIRKKFHDPNCNHYCFLLRKCLCCTKFLVDSLGHDVQ